MMAEFFKALFQAGIPVGVTSYALVWWSMRHGYFGSANSLADFERATKQHSNRSKQEKKLRKQEKKLHKQNKKKSSREPDRNAAAESTSARTDPGSADERAAKQTDELDPFHRKKLNPVHNKWLTFGGGFYGAVALLTYLLIEFDELAGFFSNFTGIIDFLRSVSVDMLIRLFIDSLLNFIAAITWPVHWLGRLRGPHLWVWLVAAYAGYWVGSTAALRTIRRRRADGDRSL